MSRHAKVLRETAETRIEIEIEIDGDGSLEGETPVPFLSHMLHQLARHGLMGLKVQISGDTEIDGHHTVEDTGIVLGQALDKALGERRGLRRFGHSRIPFDETLVDCALDLSGRGGLIYNVDLPKAKIGSFDVELAREFFAAFAREARTTVHLNLIYGDNLHHIVEACFKALARALDEATQIDARSPGSVPSSKGAL